MGWYREYYLSKDDLPMYYKGWMHEVLYDVNHNHFYRALRKTNLMHNDMRKRHAEKEYYNATHLRGIIYSLMGNMEMALRWVAMSYLTHPTRRAAASSSNCLSHDQLRWSAPHIIFSRSVWK